FAQLVNYVDPPLVRLGLLLPLEILDLNFGEGAILLLRRSRLHIDRFLLPIKLIPVGRVDRACDQQDHRHLQHWSAQVAQTEARHVERRAFLAFRFRRSQQIDSDHSFSKLLRAKPTATANWPAFCSTSSAPAPSAGARTFWNGLNNSTGIENSCRNASTSPGTLADPPAR